MTAGLVVLTDTVSNILSRENARLNSNLQKEKLVLTTHVTFMEEKQDVLSPFANILQQKPSAVTLSDEN